MTREIAELMQEYNSLKTRHDKNKIFMLKLKHEDEVKFDKLLPAINKITSRLADILEILKGKNIAYSSQEIVIGFDVAKRAR